ncbi:MAG: uncharacterized protein QOH69_7 [Actinomycetota bacterium]|jgi:uncharacterized Tic20 family protein|nr:uncharacterized protein [Actinomycetota bacterium]
MSDQPVPESAASVTNASSSHEDRLWAAIAHLGGIFFFLPSLIIFLALRKNGPTTRIESKEALNWQITFFICWVAVDILALVLGGIYLAAASAAGVATPISPALILYLIWAILWVVDVVFSLFGFLKVNSGGSYRYPFALRFIK